MPPKRPMGVRVSLGTPTDTKEGRKQMKLKKSLILLIISIILINIPAEIFAWTTREVVTYEVCNIINLCIAGTLRIAALVLAIIYIVSMSKYIKNAKENPKQKMNKIKVITIITIIEIVLLLFGASWVIDVGMETYIKGQAYQAFNAESLIPNVLRIIAFVAIFFYIIKSIIYFASEKEEIQQKIKTLIKWEVVTAIITAVLLIIAQKI